MECLVGNLLVASPHLEDPNFAKSVVLMIHHSHDGAFGVVLNRTAENTIRELWSEVSETPCQSDRNIHLGGPVSGPLMAIHTAKELSEIEIQPGLHFAAQREHLETLIAESKDPYRFFIGHAGWGGEQLERELNEGSWMITPATLDFVFHDLADQDLWKEVTHQIGKTFLSEALNIQHIPDDPSNN